MLIEALRQDRDLIAGIAAYRRHPWRRDLPDPPVLWSEGGSRLLDFGGAGPTLLLVPSLVNRASVLDLAPGPVDGALPGRAGAARAAAGLGLAGRGGAAVHA